MFSRMSNGPLSMDLKFFGLAPFFTWNKRGLGSRWS